MNIKMRTLLSILISAVLLLLPSSAYAEKHAFSYTISSDTVTLETENLTVVINKSAPELIFFYTSDGGESAKFRTLYAHIRGYNDTGNGILDTGEEICWSQLSKAQWVVSNVAKGENTDDGSYLQFSMCAVIDMQLSQGDQDPHGGNGGGTGGGQNGQGTQNSSSNTISDWAEVTFTFLIASKNSERRIGTQNYTIYGAKEMKIDFSIDVLNPVAFTNLTLEQLLFYNEGGKEEHTFRMHGQEYTNGVKGRMYRFREEQQLKQLIAFTLKDGTEQGYYTWISSAEIGYNGGAPIAEHVSAFYSIDEDHIKLYLSYPCNATVKSIYHDPGVGVMPEGFVVEVVNYIMDHIASFAIGTVIAALLVSSIVYVRLRGEGKDMAEIADLDKNPYFKKRSKL